MADEEMGGVVAQTRELMETYAKVDIQIVEEPGTGAVAQIVIVGGGVEKLPAGLFDDYRERPLFLKGTATMLSIDSFIEHANRFKDEESAVFANDDRTSPTLTAIFDYHEPAHGTVGAAGGGVARADAIDIARHMRHRSTFAFPLSDEWQAWHAQNAKPMAMADFAIFLEDRLPDVVTLSKLDDLGAAAQVFVTATGGIATVATPTKLVELSRGLKIYERAAVEEAVNLSSGEGGIRFNAEHTDGDGKAVKIPAAFIIAIPVFRNGVPYRLVARLRYRIRDGRPVFWYELWRADRAFDDAFNEAVARVHEETSLPVFTGKPEA